MTHPNTPDTSNRNTGNRNATNTARAAGQDASLDADERAHWKRQFEKEPYYEAGRTFADYESAYRIGAEGHERHRGKRFDQIESDLQREWEDAKGSARIGWDHAKQAARAAWNRVEAAMPGKHGKDRH